MTEIDGPLNWARIKSKNNIDLEMTALCADEMGYSDVRRKGDQVYELLTGETIPGIYWPLENDAQAMALVKKCEMIIRAEMDPKTGEKFWSAIQPGKPHWVKNADLNRAIVESVAKMRAAKK